MAPVAAPQVAVEDQAAADVVLAESAQVAVPASIEAPAAVTPAVAAPQLATAQPGFVSMPVVQSLPASVEKAPSAARTPAAALRTARVNRKPAAVSPVASNGTHLVQLGSFTSEQAARRAWNVYTSKNGALRNYRMTIIPATVNGKSYWRVAAAGFDAGSARSMCGSIKSRGGACLAYAKTTAPEERGGPQLARRR